MRDYHEAYDSFSLDTFAREVLGFPLDSELNAYALCCSRSTGSDRVALRWMDAVGRTRDVTYREFNTESAHPSPIC
jgi:hypothetical protein